MKIAVNTRLLLKNRLEGIGIFTRETLVRITQAHPEHHRHLIVRVWGWSGYFIELDKEYQNQIIKRVELR